MTASTVTTTTALDQLASTLSGSVAQPGQPGYDAAMPFNVAIRVAPHAVVLAADAYDVVKAVRFATENGLRVSVQATGHGAVAIGDDALLVVTRDLDECTVNVEERWARVGAGVRWQRVLDAATPHGLAPLVGSSPNVGVVGFLTGGGIGPLVRTYGPSSDHVRAIEVVTGDGVLRRATAAENSDLFWGLRGGKSTLGIVTAIEFDLMPLAEIYGGALYFDGDDAEQVVHAWREWSLTLPKHASTSLAFLQLPPLPHVPPPLAGRLSIAVRFASTASCDEAAATLARMREAATPLIDTVAPMPYSAIAAIHSDPTDPMPIHESGVLLETLPAAAVTELIKHAGPGSNSPQVVVELRRLGGAMAREPEVASALSHRHAGFSLLTIGVALPDPTPVVAHSNELVEAMAGWTCGRFPNFGATDDRAQLAERYDEATLTRLLALADRYDPAGVFRVGQAVRG